MIKLCLAFSAALFDQSLGLTWFPFLSYPGRLDLFHSQGCFDLWSVFMIYSLMGCLNVFVAPEAAFMFMWLLHYFCHVCSLVLLVKVIRFHVLLYLDLCRCWLLLHVLFPDLVHLLFLLPWKLEVSISSHPLSGLRNIMCGWMIDIALANLRASLCACGCYVEYPLFLFVVLIFLWRWFVSHCSWSWTILLFSLLFLFFVTLFFVLWIEPDRFYSNWFCYGVSVYKPGFFMLLDHSHLKCRSFYDRCCYLLSSDIIHWEVCVYISFCGTPEGCWKTNSILPYFHSVCICLFVLIIGHSHQTESHSRSHSAFFSVEHFCIDGYYLFLVFILRCFKTHSVCYFKSFWHNRKSKSLWVKCKQCSFSLFQTQFFFAQLLWHSLFLALFCVSSDQGFLFLSPYTESLFSFDSQTFFTLDFYYLPLGSMLQKTWSFTWCPFFQTYILWRFYVVSGSNLVPLNFALLTSVCCMLD